MTVTGAYQFLQNGAALLIPNGTTPDQQPWMGQVLTGGGTTTPTVMTWNLGTYSAAGTIASGTAVTWGEMPTTNGAVPTIPNQGTGQFAGTSSASATLSGTPTVGNRMIAYCSARAGATLHPPSGWNVMDPPLTTSAGGSDVLMASWFRDVQSGDGATYTWTVSGTGLNLIILEIAGGANGLMQHAAVYENNLSEGFSTPTLQPYAPNSLVLAAFCVRASVFEAPTTGWTQVGFVRLDGSGLGLIGINQSPPSTTNAIYGACSTGDYYAICAIVAFPPGFSAGSSGTVNSVCGHHVPIAVAGTSSAPIVDLNAPLGPSYGGTGLASPGPSTYPL